METPRGWASFGSAGEAIPSGPGSLIIREDGLATSLSWPSSAVLIKISIINDKYKGATCFAMMDEP